MKTLLNICILITALLFARTASAANIYTVSTSSTYSANKIPTQCTNCTINIANGATLTIDENIYLQNVTINGGTDGSSIVVDSKTVTFWAAGSFTNITASFKNTANLVNSAAITFTNSAVVFSNTSFATVYAAVNLVSSSWKFIGNAYMEATGGTFSLTSSSLTAGDGSATSHAYIKFNGSTLNIKDNTSFVTMATSNNYYFNWSNYTANGASKKTTDNNLNCGTAGKSACSAPTVYGPATLSAAGISSSATLPVKMTAFSVKAAGNSVNLSWTTSQELNSGSFIIERSSDGMNWSAIGTVKAQGNTSAAITYAYNDASPISGTISYRLKIVDLDGAFEYSPIRIVKMEAAETHEMSIYPNPATNYVVISSKGAASNVKVQLISMSGQVLKQVNGQGASINMQVSEFNAGSYIVRVAGANGSAQCFKLLIAK